MDRWQKLAMIAFMILWLIAVSLCVWSFAVQPPKGAEDEDAMRRRFREKVFAREEWEFEYVQVDGHQYLIGVGPFKRGGITHSPKCKCKEGISE